MIIEREITFRILVCGQVVPAFGPRYRGWAPLPAPPSQRKVKWSDKGATSLSPIKSSIITYAPRRAGRERGDEEAERIGQGTVENIIFFQVIRFPPALFFFVSVMGGNRITYRMKEYECMITGRKES